MWYQKKKKFLDGIGKCSKLSDDQFEQTLMKIQDIYKTSNEDLEALTEVKIDNDNIPNEEKILIIKTLYYLIQRFSTFIMSPIKLQGDLNELGFSNEKSHILIKLYSEISRPIVENLDTSTSLSTDEEVFWDIKTTLSDPMHQKCKIPKAKITLKTASQQMVFDDLTHSELSQLFDKLETIQRELDNLNK